MENQFKSLGISAEVVKGLDTLGFKEPTDVQSEAIPLVLKKRDLIVLAKTGSGKTAAFGVPLVDMIDKDIKDPQVLVLTPTRELAVQVDMDINKIAKFAHANCEAVYGQHSIQSEIKALKKGVSIISGTPGRVLDHIKKKNIITKNIKYVVLDEADRMLDMGFFDQVMAIIRLLPKKRQTMLFSATMPPEIQKMCRESMNDPHTIGQQSEAKTVEQIEQLYYSVKHNEKRSQLLRILLVDQPKSCMIFCNTRTEVDRVQKYLFDKGFLCKALHGANAQNMRMRTIDQFKKGRFQILVATDVAARGIHIDDLSLVVNYDVPQDKNSYVHRIGRTGRAGNDGKAISLVTGEDFMTFYELEEHVGTLIEERELPNEEDVKNGRAILRKEVEKRNAISKAQEEKRKNKQNANKKTTKPITNKVEKDQQTNPKDSKKPANRSNTNNHNKGQSTYKKKTNEYRKNDTVANNETKPAHICKPKIETEQKKVPKTNQDSLWGKIKGLFKK